MFERRRARSVALLGAALALTLGGAAHAAQVPRGTVEVEKWSWPKAWDYSGCISSIAMAETPSAVSAAVGMCGRALSNWFKEV